MDRMRTFRSRVALGLLFVGLLGAVAVPPASSHGKLHRLEERKKANLAEQHELEQREGTLAAKLAVLDKARAEAEAEVVKLDAELDELDGRIAVTKEQLTRKQQRLNFLTEELIDIQGDLVARTDVFTARAVAAYKAGPTAYVDSILSSQNFTEVLDRYAYYESALDADSRLVEEIQVLRDETDQRRDLVEEAKNEIATRKLALEQDRDAVAALRREKADVLAQRQAVVDAKAAVLAEVKQDRAKLKRIYEQLDAESDRLKSILAGGSSGFPTGGGQLLWPADGPLTSEYGYRTHPIFGDRRLHTGIDIGAGYGAPVIASASGTVAYVGVMGGYGNVVVIDHGGGLGTTYNHLSEFYVSSGTRVKAGQHIAAVGSTGYSTGAHLHFEVRVNGEPVDPMPYLQ